MPANHKAYRVHYFMPLDDNLDGGQTRSMTIYARSKTHAKLIADKEVSAQVPHQHPQTACGVVVKIKRLKRGYIDY